MISQTFPDSDYRLSVLSGFKHPEERLVIGQSMYVRTQNQ